jgi:hypothetical protein
MKKIVLCGWLAFLLPAGVLGQTSDSARPAAVTQEIRGAWGADIMASDGGFGLGLFYRRAISPDLSWFTTFSISESKDPHEVERFDPYTGQSFVPGKLNRFLLLPLYGGIQYRLWREEIVETFRPFVNVAIGPTMVYEMPFAKVTPIPGGYADAQQVDFFKAIGQGRAHYTLGGYVGFGANFGSERGNVIGVNFRYYVVYLLSGSLPSSYNVVSGDIADTMREFGGVVITLSFGSTF